MRVRGAVPGLWAITSYFNPVRYRRKLENYRTFRRRLTVPLVAVEHAAAGSFELGPDDADILLRVHGGAVLWQKERLLNLALDALPRECDAVAWLDADVIFDRPGWGDDACAALERLDLLHLFHERHNLPPDADLGELSAWSGRPPTSLSFVHRLVLCAALGHLDEGCLTQRMNPRRADHFLAWARPFAGALAGRVGALPGRVFHLWHGDLQHRGYEARLAILEDFDPFTDIAIDPTGCWRWSSDKPALHAAVERYFAGRREDGEERSPARDHCRIS